VEVLGHVEPKYALLDGRLLARPPELVLERRVQLALPAFLFLGAALGRRAPLPVVLRDGVYLGAGDWQGWLGWYT
jgi:hypothetical protein